MKLIINEEQYGRIFNTKKTKLILTEDQFNRLLSEEIGDLNKIEKGDKVTMVDSSGSELHFNATDAFDGQILMRNTDGGVLKNRYFLLVKTSLRDGNITYRHAEEKDIDPDEAIEKQAHDWKMSTWKEVKTLEVTPGGGGKTYSVDTGLEIDAEDDEDAKVDELREFKDGLKKGLKSGNWYKVIFYDESNFRFKVIDIKGGYISIEFEELDEKIMKNDGAAEKWLAPIRNSKEYSLARDFTIQTDNIRAGKIDKEKGTVETFDMPINLLYSEEGGSEKIKNFALNGINTIEVVKTDVSSFKGNKKVPEVDYEVGVDWDKIEQYLENNKTYQEFHYQKPSRMLGLISMIGGGKARGKGHEVTQDILKDYSLQIGNHEGSIMGNKFITDSKVQVEFADTTSSDARYSSLVNQFEEVVKNNGNRIMVRVKRFSMGDKNIILEGNVDGFYFKLYVKDQKDSEKGKSDIYQVDIMHAEEKGDPLTDIGTAQMKVLNYKI